MELQHVRAAPLAHIIRETPPPKQTQLRTLVLSILLRVFFVCFWPFLRLHRQEPEQGESREDTSEEESSLWPLQGCRLLSHPAAHYQLYSFIPSAVTISAGLLLHMSYSLFKPYYQYNISSVWLFEWRPLTATFHI